MKTKYIIKMILLIVLTFFFTSCSFTTSKNQNLPKQNPDKIMSNNLDTAVFANGCFWCTEAVFQELKGVQSVESGYSGGTKENPTYKEVCTGETGYAEAVKIFFDPDIITYDQLLEVFWTTHDPTTLNQQGADFGTQYRSAIFYLNDEQKKKAEDSKKTVATKIWDDKIVTEITKYSSFCKAEDYHQDYYNNNTNQGYCSVVISPKVKKFKEKFKDWLK